jgi:uncharacterized protein with GYD domain
MLFSISANYTAQALRAMGENPDTDRRAAVEKLVSAAGGKVVGFYFTTSDGPGVLTIIDVDPAAAAAIVGTVVATDSVRDVKMTRLWTNDEVIAVRKKRVELQSTYKAPGR